MLDLRLATQIMFEEKNFIFYFFGHIARIWRPNGAFLDGHTVFSCVPPAPSVFCLPVPALLLDRVL